MFELLDHSSQKVSLDIPTIKFECFLLNFPLKLSYFMILFYVR